MNTHPQPGEQFDLYALGVLEPEAREEMERHLQSGCPVCTAELQRAQLTVNAIGAAVSPLAPSPAVRARLFAHVRPRRAPARIGLMAAAVIILALAAGWFSWRTRQMETLNAALRRERNQLQQQILSTQRGTAALQAALAIVAAPDTRVVKLSAAPAPPAARAFYSRRGVLLVGWRLPPLPPSHTYEMWLLPAHGKPIPAGTFTASPGGTVHH
ncbi:MAG: anti-sigma factor domain-containing protein, partial [Terriglobales bacterium]